MECKHKPEKFKKRELFKCYGESKEYSFLEKQTCKYCGATIRPEDFKKTRIHITLLSILCIMPLFLLSSVIAIDIVYTNLDRWIKYLVLFIICLALLGFFANWIRYSITCFYLNTRVVWIKSDPEPMNYGDSVDVEQIMPEFKRFLNESDR